MKSKKTGCDLKSCFMCRHSMPEWLPAIDANRRSIHYKKGSVIFSEGDNMTGMFFVTEGTVKVHKQWGAEKELIVRFATKGDIVGHRGLGTDTTYPVTATALEPVSVCHIDLDFFQASLSVNQAFLFHLMMFFAEELKVSERKMRDLAHMQVKGRVARALLAISDKFGTGGEGHIDIQLSRQDLASYAGTTYETVFRIMNELVEQNLIRISGKAIAIKDPVALDDLTKDNNP